MNNMEKQLDVKIIYLACGNAIIPNYKIIYQDKYIKRDLGGDMLDIDLNNYDIIIASPPCNYYSRANYRRETSKYSQDTKHLLPAIIKKCIELKKPFIIENVINKKLMVDIIKDLPLNIYYLEHGRHSYFTNIYFNIWEIPQVKENIKMKSSKNRQGGYNVNIVFKNFLSIVLTNKLNLIKEEKE